ncbi:hypothetical protein BHE74_00043356, partial [Ensete ventricosum]
PPPKKTFSRFLIWVPKMRSCNEPSGYSEDRLVFDQGAQELIRLNRVSGIDLTGVGVISGVNSGDLAEKVTSGTNLEDLVEELISGTNPGDFTEELISGTNPGDSAEKLTSGTNLGDFTEEPISGANPGDFTEELISGTNAGDLAEKVTSGTNLRDLAEEPISGTNPGDFAEGLISGTNPVDLVEEPISDTNLGDLAEKVTSGTNPRDLAEKVTSGTNPGDLAEGLFASQSIFEQVEMTSSDSSSSVRVISSPGSGGVSQSDPEASSSGESSGPLSSIDSRVLEVMKADHDLDMAVTVGTLAMIRERYSIPTEYGLHVPQPGQRPFNSDAPGEFGVHRPCNPSTVKSGRCGGFYSNGYEAPVPEVLTASVAYRSYFVVASVVLAGWGRRSPKRPPRIQTMLSHGDYASKKLKVSPPTHGVRDSSKASPKPEPT